jgi:hypothetical protein
MWSKSKYDPAPVSWRFWLVYVTAIIAGPAAILLLNYMEAIR